MPPCPRFLPKLLPLLLAGCAFDAALPEGAVISCANGSTCPTGYECQASTSRCVRVDRADRTPPRVVSPTVTPAQAKRGDTVTATFSTDEALGSTPHVWLVQPGRSAAFVAGAPATSPGAAWTFTYVLGADDAEGLARVLADVTDQQGNATLGEPVGSVTLDFTPPSVRQAAIVAPRVGDGGVVDVRAGEAVSVRVTASEWVRDGARLRASPSGCDAGAFDFTATSNAAGLLDFTAAQPGTSGCTYTLALEELADLVGNGAPGALALGAGYRLDSEPPVISSVETLGLRDGGLSPQTVFSRQGESAAITLRFTVDETAASVDVTLDDVAVIGCVLSACAPVAAGRTCSCQRLVTPADTEQQHTFVIAALDAAGNRSIGSTTVQFDFTAPHVVPETVQLLTPLPAGCPLASASALGATATARLLFSTDEVATASVAAVPGPVLVTPGQGSPTAFTFALTPAPSGQGQGRHSLEATVTDAVGNSATVPLSLSFAIDSVPPAAPDTASDGGVVYRRVPWGLKDAGVSFTVTGQPGRTGPGLTVLALDERSFEVGRATADDAGVFSISLTPVDRPVVFVQAVDDACNKSQAVDVKDVDWVASLQRKVPGSISENPHFAAHHPDFTFALTHPDAVELGPPSGAVLGGYGRQWLSRSGPWEADGRAVVFDSRRQVVVSIGGWEYWPGPVNSVWEWDGALWRERRLGTANGAWITARSGAAAAYDVARARVVVFGGSDSSGELDDLWEWDGAQWTQPTPAGPKPGRRTSAGMAYDTQRQRVVMYGGARTGTSLDDLWEWDGRQWTDRTPKPVPTSGWPSARGGPIVYDSARGRIVLFSGDYGSRELWEWDGTTWFNRTPSPLPTSWPLERQGFCMAYDSRRGRTVIFAGETYAQVLNDIWEWNGTALTRATPSPLPATWPTMLRAHGCAFDSVRGYTLSVTGWRDWGEKEDDLLGWDGTTLEHLSHHDPRFAPNARYAASMAYDSVRRRVVLFGGGDWAGNGARRDVWEWTGARWVNRTPTPLPSNWPPAVTHAAFAFDPVRGRTVLFGGFNTNDVATRILWDWDGTSWTNRTPAVFPATWPPARGYSRMAFDSTRNRLVLFGGDNGAVRLQDLWEWDGSVWTNRTPSTLPAAWPSPRMGHLLAYDAARSRLVLHGGDVAFYEHASDTWEFDGATWVDRTPASLPAAWPQRLAYGSEAYDSKRQEVILFNAAVSFSDLSQPAESGSWWTWNGAAWQPRGPSEGLLTWPNSRLETTATYDATRDRFVTFGGMWYGPTLDHAEYGQLAREQPGVVFRFGFGFAGAEPSSVVRAVSAGFGLGGSGFDDSGQPLAGAALYLYEPRQTFRQVATSSSGAAAPTALSYVAPSPSAALFVGSLQELTFAVTPRGTSTVTAAASVAVDDAWVRVGYRRP